jgi:copper chaperone
MFFYNFLPMEKLKFKTNINCGGCIAKVTPVLNQTEGIDKWDVDINNPQKILTVETSKPNDQQIVQALQKIGYVAERIS